MHMEDIYKFKPYLKKTIWGGNIIARYRRLPDSEATLGESWELSAVPGMECRVDAPGSPDNGKTLSQLCKEYGVMLMGQDASSRYDGQFPLLIKFIDAAADLSLQVHPDNRTAWARHQQMGKTEMWVMLQSRPGARIYSGFNTPISAEEYDRRVAEGTFMEVVRSYESHPGDVHYLPAGRVHTIGAGNFLIEIQQSSDVTYRIDDYGRRDNKGNTRELHTAEAREVINFADTADTLSHIDDAEPQPGSMKVQTLVDAPYFRTVAVTNRGVHTLRDFSGSFIAVVVLEGTGTVGAGNRKEQAGPGDTFLVPSTMNGFNMEGDLRLLTVTLPPRP